MHQWDKRGYLTSSLARANSELVESSERAHDLQLFDMSSELLELSLYVRKTLVDVVELSSQRGQPPAAATPGK